jgi:hypothetical protein
VASLLIGLVQTFAVSMTFRCRGVLAGSASRLCLDRRRIADIWNVTIAQIAPIMPYLLLVLILIFRPMGLWGRENMSEIERCGQRAGAWRSGRRAREAQILAALWIALAVAFCCCRDF